MNYLSIRTSLILPIFFDIINEHWIECAVSNLLFWHEKKECQKLFFMWRNRSLETEISSSIIEDIMKSSQSVWVFQLLIRSITTIILSKSYQQNFMYMNLLQTQKLSFSLVIYVLEIINVEHYRDYSK